MQNDLSALIVDLEADIEASGCGANIGGHPCFVATFVLGILFDE